jgi:hypothetical protein
MKIKLLTLVFFCFQANAFFSQSLNIEWQKCLGGNYEDSTLLNDSITYYSTGIDVLQKIRKTTDNGYIVVGTTGSNNYDVIGNHGLNDIWVVKLNNSGAIEWQKCYGGSFNDYGNDIQQTSDGGYIVCGSTNSNDGDVVGFHGNPTYANYNYNDFFILKITNTGSIQWKKSLGGNGDEKAFSVTQSNDGGFIISGYTNTNNNGDVSGYNPNNLSSSSTDAWVVKLNSSGNFVWKKCFGDNEDDELTNIKELNDGSLLFAGTTESYIGNGNHGSTDFWLVKTDANGVVQWQKLFGGSGRDIFKSLEVTSDQGFILTGETFSHNGDVSNTLNFTSSYSDIWVLKLDAIGNIEWQRCYGGTMSESGNDIIQTSDGGFAITGNTTSFNGNVSYNYGSQDFWLLKINSTGFLVWQKSLGGTNDDVSNSLVATADGGFVLAGYIESNDYNSTITGALGNGDGWVVKLGPYNNLTDSESFDYSFSPNPTKNLITLKSDKILNKQIKILDQFGRIILESKIESTETQIDLGELSSGIYFLQMEGQNNLQKIIKE